MRPIGITILAILAGIFGILLVIGGVLVAALASVISELVEANASAFGFTGMGVDFGALFTAALVGIAAIGVIFGVLHFAIAYGFWIGAGWSRWLAIVLSILGIIGGVIVLPSGIVLIGVYALILWYLMQPYVKTFFGQGPAPVSPPAPPPV